MKKAIMLMLAVLAGCEGVVIDLGDVPPSPASSIAVRPYVPPPGVPLSDPPPSARVKNYQGGSCVHASYQTALFWQGQDEKANYWRQRHGGGFSVAGLAKLSDQYNIPYALCTDGDPAFLDWAMRTRRICAIEYYSNHAVNIVSLDQEWAVLLDNNSTGKYDWIPRDKFLSTWKNQYGGNAIAPMYQPAPPPFNID